MERHESFKVMEDFIEQIPEEKIRRKFEEIIQQKKPFQQFKNLLLDYPDLRQEWFVYKDQRYRKYVKDQIDDFNESNEETDGNPEQDLHIENEILKLKMQAERGAVFGGNMEDLPPEIEAQFLQNVQQFEDSFDKAELITIYECIGKPDFIKADKLKPEETEAELRRLIELLHTKNIILEVLGKYDLSIIYKFITEELFFEKIKDINFPSYIHNYVYEEFHPNHHVDIGRTAQEFLNHWFEKNFDEDSFEFAQQMVTADGKIFSGDEVIEKLMNCLNSYKNFTNIGFMGCDTSFEWDEKENKGLGHAEGMIRYDAEIGHGETIHFENAFKLYMINQDGFWRIFYFVFPGFAW